VRSKWPQPNLELNAQDRVIPFSAATGTDHHASFRVATREARDGGVRQELAAGVKESPGAAPRGFSE